MENENIIPVAEEPVIEKPIIPQVPPEPEKKNNLFKILIVLIGILISLGLFANAYLMFSKKETVTKTPDISAITPTQDITSDWKTYTDTEFSFKYPSDWNVKEMKSNDLTWLKTTSKYLGFGPANVGEDILGSIRVTSDTLTQVVSDTKSQRLPTGTPSRLVTEDKTVFNGYNATLLVFENTLAKVTDTSYLISRNNKTYIISEGGTKDITIITQILSTFKFIDLSVSSEWKTYSNKTYNYSFQYPQELIVSTPENNYADITYIDDKKTIIVEDSEYPMTPISLQSVSGKISVHIDQLKKAYQFSNYFEKTIKIGGRNATQFGGIVTSEGYGTGKKFVQTVIQLTANDILTIDYYDYKPKISEGIYNQILSTFKFADSSVSSDWKTYSNNLYKYSLKYPVDWQYKERENTTVSQAIWFGNKDLENIITFYVNKDKYLNFTKNGEKVTCSQRGGKEILIGENKGFIEYIPAGQNPAQDVVCFEKNGRAYEFQHVYLTVVDSKKIFDQILSTFRFD